MGGPLKSYYDVTVLSLSAPESRTMVRVNDFSRLSEVQIILSMAWHPRNDYLIQQESTLINEKRE